MFYLNNSNIAIKWAATIIAPRHFQSIVARLIIIAYYSYCYEKSLLRSAIKKQNCKIAIRVDLRQ